MGHGSIEINSDSRVTIYAAPGCQWCRATEAMLSKLGIEYHRIELELDPEGREELMRQTGRMSFPRVVIDEQVLGGYQELEALTVENGLAPLRPRRAAWPTTQTQESERSR